jgi:cytochrome c peroxidase
MPRLGGVGRASGLYTCLEQGRGGAPSPDVSAIGGRRKLAVALGVNGVLAAALLLAHGAALFVAPPATGSQQVAAGDARLLDDTSFEWHLPRGFPTPAVPADNPMSAAKVTLGRRLFFEPGLSVTGHHSCASCHEPGLAYTDGRALAVGATGQPLTHSAMSLVNVAYNISFGWTKPELQSLETQMLEPLLNEHPVELGLAGRQASVCASLAADPDYRDAFARAFPPNANPRVSFPAPTSSPISRAGVISFDNIVKAIAAFERTLIFGDSPFDRYVFGGDHDAISAQAKRGMQLFYSPRAGCGSCHSGFNFNGNWRDSQGETGKAGFANNGVGEQLMRVPTLRNVALTAPYMHDGRFATLDAVLDHYSRVAQRPDSEAKLRTFDLTIAEQADVIAFLQTLSEVGLTGR